MSLAFPAIAFRQAGTPESVSSSVWIRFTTAIPLSTVTAAVARKAEEIARLVDHMIAGDDPPADFERLKKRISDMRKAGLSHGGEFSVENLTFKALRNAGVLDRMSKYAREKSDRELSL